MVSRNIFIALLIIAGMLLFIGCEVDNDVAASGDNHSPSITELSISSPVIHTNQQGLLVVTAVDTDGDPLSYNFEFVTGSGSFQQSGGRALVSINSPGNNIVRVTVADGRGGAASSTINITSGNRAPVIHFFSSTQTSIEKTNSAAFSVFASDPDGDLLSYSYKVSSGDGMITNTNQSLPTSAVYFPDKLGGKKMITAIVRDSYGGVASQTVELNVVKSWIQVGGSLGSYATRSFVIDSNDKLYVAKQGELFTYEGTNWVSIPLPSGYNNGHFDLAADGTALYFISAANNQPFKAAKYENGIWTELATNGNEVGVTGILPNMRVDSQHRLCVAVLDGGAGSKVSVLRYTGTNWEVIGARGFSGYNYGNDRFLLDPFDGMWVACKNDSFGDRVKWFDGTNWVTKTGQISRWNDLDLAFVFDAKGSLYYAYRDAYSSNRGLLKRIYDAGSAGMWSQYYAGAGATITGNQLAFEADGRLRHLFTNTLGRIVYRRYNFTIGQWSDITDSTFSMYNGHSPSALLRLNSKEQPFILTRDASSQLIMRTLQ